MTFYYTDVITFNSLKQGLFAINKAKGITSAKTLEKIKSVISHGGVTKQDNANSFLLKVGHGGTLDSSATGVLVVGLFEGCKLLTRLLHGSKQYRVIGKLGSATDTYNDLGKETESGSYDHVTEGKLLNALRRYKGRIQQVPPKYSALKRSGQRLSDLVRQGHDVIVPAREVICYKVNLMEFSPPFFHLSVTCGPGFYIRSLINSIGIDVGSYAHVTELMRTKHGPFHLDDCLSPDSLTKENIMCAVEKCSALIKERNNFHVKQDSF